jgi:hypothetical protein
MIVLVGLCAPEVTKTEPSATYTLSRPCTRPNGSVTDVAGWAPVIMPPITCDPVGTPPLFSVAGTATDTAAPALAIISLSLGIQNCWPTCSYLP